MPMTEPARDDTPIYSVAELNKSVADLLGASFRLLWVTGEISNLAQPRSGHIYFTLKDDQAQVRCALFKNRARYVKAGLDNGVAVRVRARVGLYATRGDYQLIVEHLEDDGAGAAQRAFEQVKQKLDAEGLFAVERKQALPVAAERIGVITSATGAAVRDVLRVIARRFPLSAARIYPVAVQGDQAPRNIVAALGHAGQRQDCDVVILTRGGGSLEDLAAFNDEQVARAVAACPVPVIAGVGHEVDVTIADLAADQRAATPSAAAEAVCPDVAAYSKRLSELHQRLSSTVQSRIESRGERINALSARLVRQHPRRRLDNATQRLDEVRERLENAGQRRLAHIRQRLDSAVARHRRATPISLMRRTQSQVEDLYRRLAHAQRRDMATRSTQLANASRSLDSLSPLRTLERGYAIARDDDDTIIREADALRIGDRINVSLARGRLICYVEACEAETKITSAQSPADPGRSVD